MFRESENLPSVIEYPFAPWPETPAGGMVVEFRLVYDGKLPAASQTNTRAKEKHDIRRVFSKQLQVLWETHPRLRRDTSREYKGPDLHQLGPLGADGTTICYVHGTPMVFKRCGRQFIPLVTNAHGIGCSLDILFLRRDQPGALIRSGGDIDNRIKVLFDALRMPTHDGEVHGELSDEPKPFYCLLEDDRLITDVRITTDRLLTPRADGEHENEVRLIIHTRTIVLDPGNLGALSF